MKVSVYGIPELKKAMEEASGRIRQQFESAIGDAAAAVRDDARRFVPVDTGSLRDGIGSTHSGMTAEVSIRDPDLYYAIFVEYGTSRQPAQPFMHPAAEIERSRFVKRMQDAIQ